MGHFNIEVGWADELLKLFCKETMSHLSDYYAKNFSDVYWRMVPLVVKLFLFKLK